jgi:type IV secretion system protein VirB5
MNNITPETPYLKAKHEWDERIGSSRVQAKNWRLVAILALIAALFLAILSIISLSLKQNNVFIAEVTKTGQVVNVIPLKIPYQPTVMQKEYFISNFIKLIRQVPMDPVAAKQNWLSAYYYLTKRSSKLLDNFLKEHNPLAILGKKTVSIKISDINPVSNKTFHVNWSEKIIDVTGEEEQEQNFSGVFTIMVKQPTTEQAILHNPLGIYITDFNISAGGSKQ